MSPVEAIQIIEAAEGTTDDQLHEWLDAWQCLLDAGILPHLQGSYQRTAEILIAEGVIA